MAAPEQTAGSDKNGALLVHETVFLRVSRLMLQHGSRRPEKA
jgi:hypothetical protein